MYLFGCSKNLVDTEVAIGIFKKNNFSIVNNPREADIIVVNTCGFINSAKEEAINTIFEMAEYKKKRCKYLIVMGCLAQRYYNELVDSFPEVDLFVKLNDYDEFWEQVENLLNGNVEIKKDIQKQSIAEKIFCLFRIKTSLKKESDMETLYMTYQYSLRILNETLYEKYGNVLMSMRESFGEN